MSSSRISKAFIGAAVLIAASVLVSCGGSASSSSIASVVVIPTVSSVKVNGTETFTANALDSTGNTVSGQTFTWTSSDPNVATISSAGVATGKNGGTTQITATASTQTVTSSPVTLTVTPTIGSVSIAPVNATIKVGEQQQFTAAAKDVNGNAVNGAVFSWAISYSGIATIDNNGLATGVSPGQVVVTATSGGVTSPVATLNVTN